MLLATLLAVAALAVLTDHPAPAANAQGTEMTLRWRSLVQTTE